MKSFFRGVLPPTTHPAYAAARFETDRAMSMDIQLRREFAEFQEKLPSIWCVDQLGGSGLSMAEALRSFALEYTERYGKHGPWTMPSSFNIVEAFLPFARPFGPFRIATEREHLLDVASYFDWYTGGTSIQRLDLLAHSMDEATAYTFEFGASGATFPITIGERKFVMASLCLVRHATEVSAILLGGESPPSDPANVDEVKQEGTTFPDESGIVAHPDLSASDRFLPTLPGHSRTIALARFDIDAHTYDRRYVLRDCGPMYDVLTDDTDDVYPSKPGIGHDRVKLRVRERLQEFGSVFSVLACLLGLPTFFVEQHDRVFVHKVATPLHDARKKARVTRAGRYPDLRPLPFFRELRCVPAPSAPIPTQDLNLVPPLLGGAKGYWRPLSPGEIGRDREGNKTIGRTWVARTESWFAEAPSALLMKRTVPVEGADPGILYVARSPAHVKGVLKIGITRRSDTSSRMSELSSSTATPLPFEVLWSWDVGNCGALEAAVHEALKPYRLRDNREFFHLELRTVTEVVERLRTQK